MRKIHSLFIFIFVLTACDVWNISPQPFPVWTPIPSRTPGVITVTPMILSPTPIGAAGSNATIISPETSLPVNTETPSPTVTPTLFIPSETPTFAQVQSVTVDILGCNTSIDITHGMGEVTNAYVVVKNTGTVDLPNNCALLRAIDEDQQHPDKKVCVVNLPVQNQVTLKLTVDSAYQEDTIIQVDISSNEVVLLRVDKPSCTDIGLFGSAPSDLGVIKPIQ